jgi:hypothetical protein
LRTCDVTAMLARTGPDAPATVACGIAVMVALATYDRMRSAHVHDGRRFKPNAARRQRPVMSIGDTQGIGGTVRD